MEQRAGGLSTTFTRRSVRDRHRFAAGSGDDIWAELPKPSEHRRVGFWMSLVALSAASLFLLVSLWPR